MPGIKTKLLLVYSILVFILSIFAFFAYQITRAKKLGEIVSLNASPLKSRNVIKSCTFNSHNFILFLSLDCDHCSDAIALLKERKDKLTVDNAFVLAFNEKDSLIRKFIASNDELIETKRIAIYNDEDRYLYKSLNVHYYPALFELSGNLVIPKGNGMTGLKNLLNEK